MPTLPIRIRSARVGTSGRTIVCHLEDSAGVPINIAVVGTNAIQVVTIDALGGTFTVDSKSGDGTVGGCRLPTTLPECPSW